MANSKIKGCEMVLKVVMIIYLRYIYINLIDKLNRDNLIILPSYFFTHTITEWRRMSWRHMP